MVDHIADAIITSRLLHAQFLCSEQWFVWCREELEPGCVWTLDSSIKSPVKLYAAKSRSIGWEVSSMPFGFSFTGRSWGQMKMVSKANGKKPHVVVRRRCLGSKREPPVLFTQCIALHTVHCPPINRNEVAERVGKIIQGWITLNNQ